MNTAVKFGGPLIFASLSLLAFIGLWEGEKQYTVYADELAGGLPTVCRGLTKHVTTKPIIVGDVWSADQCSVEETRAITKLQSNLVKCFRRIPPQSVFDAATSHAWNFGLSATCGSEAMQAWNIGLWELGCRRLHQSDSGKPVWSFVKTGRYVNEKPEFKFIKGLANRRKAESAMCLGHVPLEIAK